MKHRNNEVNSRKAKQERGEDRVIKSKFQEERSLPPIQAKTEKQKQYLRLLNDPEINVVIALGLHGVGKTYITSCVAADAYRKGYIEKIIVSRAYVQTGKTSGYKPGSSLEKLYAYVRNVLDTIKSRIGEGAFEVALKDGVVGDIEVQEMESIRGRSFDQPSFLIVDEAQQITPEEMKSVVTRISDKCKLVLCGDENQKDIHGESGMMWLLKFAERHNIKSIGVVDFNDPEDIVRGGFVKDVAIGLMKDKKGERK